MALFKFGNYEFPDKHIKYDSFDIKPSQRQDLDSYTDGFGVTQRNALSHYKTEISFVTLSMSKTEMDSIMEGITSNYINENERNAQCTYYNDEKRVNMTGKFYMDPSIKFRKKQVNKQTGEVEKYGEMTWNFIEY